MIHVLLTKFRKPSALAGGFLFFSLLLFSCASSGNLSDFQPESKNLSYIPSQFSWQGIKGLDFAEYFFFENKNIPLRYHCLKINLSDPSLKILTYPNSKEDFMLKDDRRTEFFKGLTAKQFSRQFDSAVTVNATPFEGKAKSKKLALLSSIRKICGIHIVSKEQFSPPVKKYGAICFLEDENGYTGKILKNQEAESFKECDYAFGGFFVILQDFKKQEFQARRADSRTALALSEDGKTLFLLCAEGERRGKSVGLSYQDSSDILLAAGAKDAIQMDGGGSTSLFVNGKNFLSYPSIRKNAVFIGFSMK